MRYTFLLGSASRLAISLDEHICQRTADRLPWPSRSSMAVPCVLNSLDANLGVSICDQLTARTRSDGGWGYTWSGVRGTVGVSAGTYRYTVRLLRSLPVELPQHPDGPESYPAVRVGVSFPTTDVGMLGEAPGSWALSSTGSVAGDGGEPVLYSWELTDADEVRLPPNLTWQTAGQAVRCAVNLDL